MPTLEELIESGLPGLISDTGRGQYADLLAGRQRGDIERRSGNVLQDILERTFARGMGTTRSDAGQLMPSGVAQPLIAEASRNREELLQKARMEAEIAARQAQQASLGQAANYVLSRNQFNQGLQAKESQFRRGLKSQEGAQTKQMLGQAGAGLGSGAGQVGGLLLAKKLGLLDLAKDGTKVPGGTLGAVAGAGLPAGPDTPQDVQAALGGGITGEEFSMGQSPFEMPAFEMPSYDPGDFGFDIPSAGPSFDLADLGGLWELGGFGGFPALDDFEFGFPV